MRDPYAPPAEDEPDEDVDGDDETESRTESETSTAINPTRTAALIFIIEAALACATSAAGLFFGFVPSPLAILVAVVQVALGVGLLRYGRKLVPATVFAIAGALIYQGALSAILLQRHPRASTLAVPLAHHILVFSPPLLLLLGRPGRWRIRIAKAAFVGAVLFNVATWGFAIWAWS